MTSRKVIYITGKIQSATAKRISFFRRLR